MSRKNYLNFHQIEDMLDLSLADDNASEDEEDIENFSEHNSDSEQSVIDEEIFESEQGYDENGMCCSDEGLSSKTLSHNIIRFCAGPTLDASDCMNTINVFKKFFNENMLESIRVYTNQSIYRSQQNYKTAQTYNSEVQSEELWAFIGLMYLIGVSRSAHENVLELWSTNGDGRDIFRAVMSAKRFMFLVQNLRFDDKDTREIRR